MLRLSRCFFPESNLAQEWNDRSKSPIKLLLLNQTFYPDVAATAQQAADLAAKLAERGARVTVIASRRAYDNPGVRFPRKENWRGVRIFRVRCSGFGKKAKWRRAVDFATFMLSCCFRLLTLGRFDVVVALTSPPLISLLASFFVRLRGGRLVTWMMDLNPEEAIAAGWLREKSLAGKLLSRTLRFSLEQSDAIVVLDRFMRDRIVAKGISEQKIVVLPPWSHSATVRYDQEGRATFRRQHGLEDKFVVMYSGNHSPCHPLDTLLQAAWRLSDRPQIAFCFVGGGSEFDKVRTFGRENDLKNIVCLPYQPLEKLSASLSAADLHVVVMGDAFVGIVHPCKIYNILTLGMPFLYIGPAESHIAELLPGEAVGDWAHFARHEDVDTVVQHILQSAKGGARRSSAEMRLADHFSQKVLVARFVELLERMASAQRFPSQVVEAAVQCLPTVLATEAGPGEIVKDASAG